MLVQANASSTLDVLHLYFVAGFLIKKFSKGFYGMT